MLKGLALALLLMAQQIMTGHYRKVFTPAGCTPPTVSDRWAFYDSNTTCTSGGACSNGGSINFAKDLGTGGNNAAQPHSGHYPIYNTNQLNTLAAGNFSAGNEWMEQSAIPTATGQTISLYAVVYYDAGTTAVEPLTGNEGTGSGVFVWRFDTNNKQEILSSGVLSVATSTVAYTTPGFFTFEVDYNDTTKAYAFKHCSGGTCTTDTSGTGATAAFSNPATIFGGDDTSVTFWTGQIVEFGYYNGYGVPGLGAWSQCKYGI